MPSSTGDRQQRSLADYCAAERNLPAWIGTGLAMMGCGFVVARCGPFLQQIHFLHQAPAEQSLALLLGFGKVLIIAGLAVNVFAGWRHHRMMQDLDRGAAPRSWPFRQAVTVVLFLAMIGFTVAIYMVSA
ncbi:MAG: DUF202 domain-containing protein [Terracidiphilus sp.]|jgi:putative membrane protein